jgi:hypothetical protein
MRGPLEELKYVEDLIESEEDNWSVFRWLGKYYLAYSYNGTYDNSINMTQITEDQYTEYRDKLKKEDKVLTEEKKEVNSKKGNRNMKIFYAVAFALFVGLGLLVWFTKFEWEDKIAEKYTEVTQKGNTQHVIITKYKKDKLHVTKECYDAAIIDSWNCELTYKRNMLGYIFEKDAMMTIRKDK